MRDENLKPCPFCGGKAKLIEDYFDEKEYPKYIAIMCDSCFCQTHTYFGRNPNSKEKAIEAWNTRARKFLLLPR